MLVSLLAGCGNTSQSESSGDSDISSNSQVEESKTPERIDGKKLYEDALEAFKSVENFKLSSEYSLSVEVGTESRNESGKSEETFLSYGEKDMAYYSESETVFGEDRTVQVKETLLDDVVYLLYDDNGYYSSPEGSYEVDFFDAELYGEITQLNEKDENGNTVITFAQATAVEEWIAFEYAVLVDASGEIRLDAEGNIVSLKYSAEYEQGAAYNEMEYSFTVEALDEASLPEITKPEKLRTYKSVKSVSAVMLLDEALMHLADLGTYSYNSDSLMGSGAMGSAQQTRSTFKVFNYGEDYASKFKMEKQSVWIDLNKGEWREDSVENETTVLDGKKTTVINGKKDTLNMDENDIDYYDRSYRSSLTFCVPELADITDVELTGFDGYVTIKMTCGSSFGEDMRKKMDSLLENIDELEEITDDYKTKKIEFVLTVDVDTHYPVAINLDYEGVHVFQGRDYEYNFEYSASITPANPDIYYDIAEKHHPDFDKEPEAEDTAKPLFYKVTDANGNVLWLLGTIHIGDNRTAYLPKEIYEAFNASDAAAFEIDVVALNEAMKLGEDDKLAELVYEAYFYEDGTIDENIDDQLYRDAKALFDALALGTYGDLISYMENAKPNYWASSLSNTYLGHSMGIYYNKGVDLRLLMRAKAADKKIYEIEDSYRQFTMDINASDDFHEFSLYSTLYYSRSEFRLGNIELYEAWCKGDLEELTALINEPVDYTGMTEDEIKAYEEYYGMLQTDRDALMLEKAKEYLASGETVFYAVGLAHLLNEDTGLVKALSDAGYTVELVEYK